MNRLLTYAGQQPVYLGDIDFMQDASKNVFTYLARALMSSGSDSLNAILQGVDISIESSGGTATFNWTAGVVVINGEVMPVAAGSITGETSSTLYFHVNSVKSGSRTFKDGVSRECWDSRSAIIDTQSTGGLAVDSVPRMSGEDVSDDAIYQGVVTSLQLTSARLIKRSGLWICDVGFNFEQQAPGAQYTIVFNGLTPGHLSQLALQSFIAPFAVKVVRSVESETSVTALEIIPMSVSFSSIISGNSIQMYCTIDNSVGNLQIVDTAKLQSLIPIF
jgi:hypothetical protein